MRRFVVEVRSTVIIDVREEGTVFTRVTENHDDEGVPQPDERGSGGWRNSYYQLDGEAGVVDMFAYNAVSNGVRRASQLDGWGDLGLLDVTMDVTDVEVDGWTEADIDLPVS